jgi:acyl-CoA dehydrogenase
MLNVYGADHAPNGHAHLKFTNVKVPKENLILGEGRGFEIAQGRLGPGRIHHCMRIIGVAERALDLLCSRSLSRTAFGKTLSELGGNYDVIADCRIEIEMCRLMTLKAAYMMDTAGNKIAKSEIAQIKVAIPLMATKVIDKAIQIHGGAGVSQDTPLATLYASVRYLRIGDGPDEVHRRAVARHELGKHQAL